LNYNQLKHTIKSHQINEFGWYLFGTIVPIFFNFIRNPIFTRHFTPDEYGYYSLVFLTFNYLALIFFSWLASIIWRYYYEYKNKNKLHDLFSSLGLIYIAGSGILLLITIIWFGKTESILVRKIIVFSFFYYLINDFTSFYLVTIRLEKKIREYNLLQSIRAIINFLFLCVFTFVLNFRIEAIALSYFISTLLLIIYIIFSATKNYKFIFLGFKQLSRDTLQKIFRYGLAGLLANVCILILYSSDRYFVALYNDIGSVGIYNQNYIIAQTAISAITMAFYNTINPDFNRCLTEDIKNSRIFISGKMFNYLLLMAPITLFISIFAYEFNFILLGEKFREGYPIISYVALSLFLYGWTTFSETKLKFANRLFIVIIGFVAACFINITLNYFLLRIYDYTWAAKTTLIAFIFLFLYFLFFDKQSYLELLRTYYSELIILLFTIFSILIINSWARNYFNNSKGLFFSIIEFLVFSIILSTVILLLLLKKRKAFKSNKT